MSVMNIESVYDTLRKTLKDLSDIEKSVFYGRLDGKSFQTIADEINSTYDKVYLANQELLKKLNASYKDQLRLKFGNRIK